MSVPLWLWFAVLAVILIMLAVDLVAHRGAKVVSLREAAGWSAAWVTIGLGFGAVVWAMFGAQAAGEYYAGYVIEKSLAVDNIFVFALIFTAFAVPRAYQHRVLFYGVLGALVMRGGFIAGGAALINEFAWVLYLFGAFLVATGVQMFRHRNQHSDPTQHPILRLTRRVIPNTTTWHGTKFWVKEHGRWVATPLFTVLILIESTDLIFAVDSIPAIFAVTQEPFLVFTSNAFAILGLRAMYFLLADLIHRFVYLKVGLAAVLVFVGVKMLLLDVYKIPIGLSLTVIAALITASVLASLMRTRHLTAGAPDDRSSHGSALSDQPPTRLDLDRRPLMSATDSTSSRSAVLLLTPGLVTSLQSRGAYPAVSLLMSTTPAPRMLAADLARLTGLAREVERRLDSETLPGTYSTVLAPLADLVARAGRGPTTAAVGVFVSAAISTVVHLPVLVNDRAVIDPTFATRDLVRALHRTPRHVVLALSPHEARLFDGQGDDLRPVRVSSFPRRAAGTEPASAPGQVQQSGGRRQHKVQPHQRRSFFHDVDRALGAYLRLHPAPLVLVDAERVLAEFRQASGNVSRLAGSVRGSLLTAPTSNLIARIRPVLNDYLHSRQQEALDLLDQRTGAKRAVSGIESAWLAARTERPEMLAVEEGYFYPARLDPSGDLLAAPGEVEDPEVIDDAVDELIEMVLSRGGWVALVEDGTLADHSRVALTLRR